MPEWKIKAACANSVPADFSDVTVHPGEFFFLPFNLTYGSSFVKSAKVTPLTKIQNGKEDIFVFYRREDDKSVRNFFDFGDKPEKFLVLDRKDALNLWKVKDRLIITDSDSYALEDESGGIEII